MALCGFPKDDGSPCKRQAGKHARCSDHREVAKGRHKLTAAVHAQIVKGLRSGCYRKDAAAFADVGTSTFYRWMERGEADAESDRQSVERDLWEAVARAEADAVVRMNALIAAAAPKDWKAAAWWLERKLPDDYGRRDRLEVTKPRDGGLDLSRLSDEQLDQLEALYAAAGAGDLGA